jgi:predicted transcriptional regulator
MVRTQIYLPDEQIADLRQVAEAQKRTVSDLIREALGIYLGRQEMDPWDLLVGIGASGRDDGALHHDEVYDQ